MNIGERIKQLRTDKNLTQPQLAELANIEQSYLSKLENDKSIPSADILNSLLKALEIDIPLFLKGISDGVIQRYLVQMPEVAIHLDSESQLRVHHAKRWLMGSALGCALGLALLFGGLKLLIFTPLQERVYFYVSDGIIKQEESEDLFKRWESSLAGSIYAGQRITPELDVRLQEAKEKFRKRFNTDTQQSTEYKGRQYRIDVPGGYRIYEQRGETVVANEMYYRANNWLAVLGVFLLFSGLFGFVVEFRLRRL